MLPCGNVDVGHLDRLEPDERSRYARATAYHTAFVMGFLCAASLHDRSRPPTTIDGRRYPDATWMGFLAHVDDDQGDWLDVFADCDNSEKAVLAPMLCYFAILQTLRRRDYRALRDVLVLAARPTSPNTPCGPEPPTCWWRWVRRWPCTKDAGLRRHLNGVVMPVRPLRPPGASVRPPVVRRSAARGRAARRRRREAPHPTDGRPRRRPRRARWRRSSARRPRTRRRRCRCRTSQQRATPRCRVR